MLSNLLHCPALVSLQSATDVDFARSILKDVERSLHLCATMQKGPGMWVGWEGLPTVSRSRMSSHRMWLVPLAICTLSSPLSQPAGGPKAQLGAFGMPGAP